ncbi:MAG TPA: DUF4846 domain-containing protein, partial [Bacteroidia bacterium]
NESMKSVFYLFLFISCGNVQLEKKKLSQQLDQLNSSIDTLATTVSGRFHCPDSFTRKTASQGSFTNYLRDLNLKPYGSEVKYFDGTGKYNNNVYASVIDMPITNKDLQQCADAVMRLRGEFLFKMKRYNEISFRFTGDGKMHGYVQYAGNDRSYETFRKYMDHVFNFANTASLFKQLKAKSMHDIEPGDVLIQTGNPYGHAVIVLDVCSDNNGNKQYMLAQSYMPAQETQVLLNPLTGGVWYSAKTEGTIETPEYNFEVSNLRTW